MAKHEKNKAGLQKGISSIFKGISIPQTDDGREPSGTSAPERTDYIEPKPPVPDLQKSEAPKAYQATQTLPKAAPEHTDDNEPKQPTPEPQKIQTPKAYQATQTLPKAAPDHTDDNEPKQPTPEQQKIQTPKAYQATQTLPKAAPDHTDDNEPKQPTPEPQKTQASKTNQVTPSLTKAATAPQPKTEPVQRPKTEPVHLPEFVTAQQSKVVPAQRPKAEPVQKSKVVPAQQPKAEPVQQSKVVPTRQPKGDIDKDVSTKRPIVKISNQSFWQQIRGKLFQPKPGVSSVKQKAMVVMMPLLFIILIFMLFKGGVFGTSAGHTEVSAEDTASGVVTAGADTKIDWEIPAPYPATLRDPMRLVPVEIPQTDEQTETGKTIELIVKSILYSEDNPSAVINGRIVHEGEKIRDASVIKISKDSVEFEMNGKRWTQKVQ